MDNPEQPPCVLMFRWNKSEPDFKTCEPALIGFWRWRGFFVLADEREWRDREIEDVRQSEERRFGRPE